MIPRAAITAWRAQAPWAFDWQVEQDLVVSRALVDIFARPGAAGLVAARGGTILHKLVFPKPGRYSEDIDLVQINPGPIADVVDLIRDALRPWLGEHSWERRTDSVRLEYRFHAPRRARLAP